MDTLSWRTCVLSKHLNESSTLGSTIRPSICLQYYSPEASEKVEFNTAELRRLLDGHNIFDRDWIFDLILESNLFCSKTVGSRIFVMPDFNQSMEQQREMTLKRIYYLLKQGVFQGWLTGKGPEAEMRKLALFECLSTYDHSLSVKLGVHYFLWGGAIRFFGTKRHHDKWLKLSESYVVKGCFAMTELGHGSNVRGIETITTYDTSSGEFIVNTPCESAQKYWIGGAAKNATHTIVFSQLHLNGSNKGVHAFIVQIRDKDGNVCPNIRVADCGHKIGLNGVDNGRIWFDNVRIPRENLLNSVADVSENGQYLSSIKDPDQRFAAFLAPLTTGRITIATNAVNISKTGLAIAIRYALTRRAFTITDTGPEVLLLDYPSHQRRLFPLLAKTLAMNFAGNYLKAIYVERNPETMKQIHVFSSAFKATFTWHNMRTLQECREACGGQGLKTENRVGGFKAEYDVQSTFEGDNNILMQQVSRALFAEHTKPKRSKKALAGLGLEHINSPALVVPCELTNSVLQSSSFQIGIFRLRERDLLGRFVSEVSKHQGQGAHRDNAFLTSFQLADDLARAFSDRAILQSFVEVEDAVSPGSLKDVLALVRSLYALVILEEDISFLRYGYLSPNNAAFVRKEVLQLCSKLRPHALALVSSFGIPDAFLSPLAFDWIKANAWTSSLL